MNDFEIDSIATLGYRYANGEISIPNNIDNNFKIDCFNAGIANYNTEHSAYVPPILKGMKSTWLQGSNNGCADKELAIVGA